MRDFTKVSPSVWKSRKFRALENNTDARLAYLYILTSPHASSAGCYDLPEGYASADLGWEIDRYREAIDRLCGVGLIEFSEGENTVWVTNWAAFNSPTNGKHAMAILNDLRQASCRILKYKAFQQLMEIIVSKGYDRDPAFVKLWPTYQKAFANPIPEPIPEATCTRLEVEVDSEVEVEGEETRREKTKSAQVRAAASDAATPNGAASDPPKEDAEPFIGVPFASGNGLSEVSATEVQHRLLTPLLQGKGRAPPPKFKRSDYGRRH